MGAGHSPTISIQNRYLCPVKTDKQYTSLLNKDIEIFFQYLSKNKQYYTFKAVGKIHLLILCNTVYLSCALNWAKLV